jgi:phosphohistidine phosphatase SixA
MPSRHGGKVGDRAMTLQGHYLSRIAARSVASQCFELGLIVVTPMAQARVSTRTIVAAVISNAPVSTPASRSRVIINPRHK